MQATTDTEVSAGWIIGIGASAGGLEALTQFVANIPEELVTPIIIAQHLAPKAKSMMVELLQRHCARKVVSALDQDQIEERTIYIVPPNFDIDIHNGKILLTVAGEATRPKPSINEFFGSLAHAYGTKVIGIVLSGTGSDGSDGITAIKAAGGMTLAQDDQSAKYDGMPNSAVHTGFVDTILPPAEMAKALPGLLREQGLRQNQVNHKDSIQRILHLIKESHGTDFARYKISTIQRRMIRRMSNSGYSDYDAYLKQLQDSPAELAQLSKELLVSVTSFFRDPEAYAAMDELISRIVDRKRQGEEIRVWVAGCATGEEAYTLAMVILEKIGERNQGVRLKIFATDLDQDALIEAREGLYSNKDCEKIPEQFLRKYFHNRGDVFEVSERLREVIVFARQDLTNNPPFVKVDLVTCRNVLIYFNSELQNRIIETFHYALNPSGILFLGKSEGVNTSSPLFDVIDRVHKIFGKLNVPSKAPTGTSAKIQSSTYAAKPTRLNATPSIAESAYLRLLNSYGICGVAIDENCNIIHLIGNVSPYLGFFTPHADFRLMNLLPKGVGIEIPVLIRRSSDDGKAHRSRTYTGTTSSPTESYVIVVRPLTNESESSTVLERRLFIVNFEPQTKDQVSVTNDSSDVELGRHASAIEQELFMTREHLQTVIEELGVSNEEMQSLNEELSSTNEELQASGEELETTNEELQSSNEELTTLNDELSAKNHEVRSLNLSFENVQNSIGIPMVLLNEKMEVVRYNPEARKLFYLGHGDLGRNISRVSSNFEIEGFEKCIQKAINNGQTTEEMIEVGPTFYQMRILPCYDESQSITGAILTFVDNTQLLRIQRKIQINEERLTTIVNGSSGPIFLKDTFGRYLMVNDAFRDLFRMDDRQIIGKTDREIFDDRLALQFREADLQTFMNREPSEREENIVIGDRSRHYLIRRFPIFEAGSKTPYAIGAVATDITRQNEDQEKLRISENRYRGIVEDRFVFVCRSLPNGELTYTNQTFIHQFGHEFEIPSSKKFNRLFDEIDRPRIQKEMQLISAQNPLVQFESRVAIGDKAPIWVRWILRASFDNDGKTSEFQAVGFDVTELRQQTDQLLERDSVYSRVFDYTVDFLSIYRVDKGEFFLESFNSSAAKSMGFSSNDVVGRNLRQLLRIEQVHETIPRYRRAVDRMAPEVFDQQIETEDGVRYFATTIVPIPGLDGRIERVAAISRDVSQQKLTEFDLRRAKEEADIANRTKSEFLASMSHELRTPLNVVIGMSQLLSDSEMTPEQTSFAASIYRSGKVLLALIEDVLDVSRIEAGKMNLDSISFSPAQVVEEVLELFTTQAKEKRISLIAEVQEESAMFVIGDPARLRQVIVNLVSNALKFTDRGSVSLLTQAVVDQSSHELRFRLTVKDTGIGIPEEAHRRLFQRFSQIDSGNARKYGGSGLGLTISKSLVQMMNGHIGFDSSPGHGSSFWIDIPFHISNNQDVGQRARTVPKVSERLAPSRPLKILAVDDSTDSRAVIGHFLQRLGHDSVLATGGHDALDRVRNESFDLILMDIQMPDIDGYEATAEIRKMSEPKNRLPVVALTANAMAGDAKRAFDAGMDDYLSKPIQLKALKDLLAKWAARTAPDSNP